jgi:branched-chain amino acid transport system ATP-binding protein
MTNGDPVLRLTAVELAFDGNRVLSGVDLAFAPGFNGLIGPNGAGKTTLFNVISGYAKPSTGTVELLGRKLTGLSSVEIARAGVGRTFQSPKLVLDATVLENTLLGRHYLYRWGHFAELIQWRAAREEETHARQVCMEALAQFGLAEFAHRSAQSLSLGSQKLVEVARALVGEPKVVLLDEPAAGLGAEDARLMLKGLRSYAQNHRIAFVIIEHDLELVTDLCDTVSVLDYGKIIASGRPTEVTSNHAVIEAYLGSGFSTCTKRKEGAV